VRYNPGRRKRRRASRPSNMHIGTLVSRLGLAALLGTCIHGHGQTIRDRAANDDITVMGDEEPAMRKAFQRAAATLPDFLALAARPREGISDFSLKVAISDGRNTEYFWVGDFAPQGEAFTGTLDNEPRLVRKYKMGERITFQRAQVVDWAYTERRNGRMMGNFTACALLSKEPPAEAAAFKKQYGLSCDD